MALASSSPSPKMLQNGSASPATRYYQMGKSPYTHHINTSLPQNFTNTPASLRSASSSAPSPYLLSTPSTPDLFKGQDEEFYLPSSTTFELPESAMGNVNITPKAALPKEPTSPAPNKANGIIRKFSQSARAGSQMLRRKTSSSGQNRRDHSSGPITRRRSDSKTAGSNQPIPSDLPPGESDDTRLADSLGAFGINDSASIVSEPISPIDSQPEGNAPILPNQLIQGTPLTKMTKKRKRKTLNVFLTPDGSRVGWNSNKPWKGFWVDDIRGIRYGDDALNYRQDHQLEEHETECWFTILYADRDRSKQTKTIHLLAPQKQDMVLWIDTLEALSKHREELMTGMSGSLVRENVIKAHWDREMRKQRTSSRSNIGAATLDLQAVELLCRSLHIHCSKTMIKEQFRLADTQNSGQLNYDEFKEFVRLLKERKDILPIYKSLVRGNELGISRERFLTFLDTTQGVDVGLDVNRWNNEFSDWVTKSRANQHQTTDPSSNSMDVMDFEAFASFLASESCQVYEPSTSKATFDRPLNEYFISSSHNTYLRGRQVAGDSSTEAYITALRHGCRCVEIDCWNGQDGRPIVTHGHTRTTSVLFLDCINVINRYAFESSEYPVILSLEVHCDAEQQMKMVSMMKEVFGEKLVLQPLVDQSTELPSPDALKKRILVKVKASEIPFESNILPNSDFTGRQRSASSPRSRPNLSVTPLLTTLPMLSNQPTMSSLEQIHVFTDTPQQTSPGSSSGSGTEEESDAPTHRNLLVKTPQKPKTSKISKPLAELGVYLQGFKYRGMETTEARQYNHIFSLNENDAYYLSRSSQDKAQFEDHNLRYMLRVYPKTLRFTSKNFDPNEFWRRGVQMVALNWQTYDSYMQINQAMFAAGTDRHGYVLKPDYLRKPREIDSITGQRLKLPRRLVRFSIEMISAQQLPRLHSMDRSAGINPFIEIQIFSAEDKTKGIARGSGGADFSNGNGASGIGSPYARRTNVEYDNGYNPQFNECFDFSVETKYPELIFIRWIVWNSPNGRHTGGGSRQLAVFTAKLTSLLPGYRHLPLFNGYGEEFIFSTLFCKIKKEEPILIPSSVEEVSGKGGSRGLIRTVLTRTRSSSERGADRLTSTDEQRRRMLNEIRERAQHR